METKLFDIGHGLKAGIVNITPEQAKKMLEHNTNNRAVKKAKMSQYAMDMEDGLWQLNGVPIVFNCDGLLIDGQNRLYAGIRSNMAFESIVITGVSKASFLTIDTGANRTAGDILSIYGLERARARSLAALIQRLHQQKRNWASAWHPDVAAKTDSHETRQRCKLTNQLVLKTYKEDEIILNLVYDFCFKYYTKVNKIIKFSIYLLAFYNLHKINISVAEEFFEKLATGENLTSNNPIYHLREKLISLHNSETEKVPSWHYPALIYKTWNAYRKGNVMQKLFISSNEKEPQKPI